ncbi:MAG: phosphomethylpyrimidine synthase ThiC, partial [Pyrinomonadaceae bacterium]
MSITNEKNEKNEQQSHEVQLPNSRRVYVGGPNAAERHVRVPFREVALNPTRGGDGQLEENPPVLVYDASGPWGDPAVRCDEREGLPGLRREWILARVDVEEYAGREVKPEDDGYLTAGAREYAQAKTRNRLEY